MALRAPEIVVRVRFFNHRVVRWTATGRATATRLVMFLVTMITLITVDNHPSFAKSLSLGISGAD